MSSRQLVSPFFTKLTWLKPDFPESPKRANLKLGRRTGQKRWGPPLPDIWYVSYRSNITPQHDSEERRCARAARRFKTEADAKQFAEEIVRNGWSAIAGTLNPHKPKKTVPSSKILAWIAGRV